MQKVQARTVMCSLFLKILNFSVSKEEIVCSNDAAPCQFACDILHSFSFTVKLNGAGYLVSDGRCFGLTRKVRPGFGFFVFVYLRKWK